MMVTQLVLLSGPEEVSRKQGLVASFMDNLPSGVDPQSKIHPGAGCDYCGVMFLSFSLSVPYTCHFDSLI